MNTFLKRTVLFGFFAFAFYLLAIVIWGFTASRFFPSNLNYRIGKAGHSLTRFQEVKTQKDLDILFIGSSHAYRTFDTRMYAEIGLKTFNLGSSAQSPLQTEVILNRYLKQLNPKKIVFEVSPIIFDSDGIEAALDLISNDNLDEYIWKMVSNIHHIKAYNTTLFAWIKHKMGDLKKVKEPNEYHGDRYVAGGFVERLDGKFKPSGHLHPLEIEFNPKQIEAFERCLNLIAEQGSQLILVYTPVTKAMANRYSNPQLFDQKMKQYGQFINLNGQIELIDSLHFYDDDHLNQKGVELINKYFIDYLAR